MAPPKITPLYAREPSVEESLLIFNFDFIKFAREREESALVRVKESEQELTRLDNERIRLLREVIIINKIYDNYDRS